MNAIYTEAAVIRKAAAKKVVVTIPRGGVVFTAGTERSYVEVRSGIALLESDGEWLIEWRKGNGIYAGRMKVSNGSVTYGGDRGITYRVQAE